MGAGAGWGGFGGWGGEYMGGNGWGRDSTPGRDIITATEKAFDISLRKYHRWGREGFRRGWNSDFEAQDDCWFWNCTKVKERAKIKEKRAQKYKECLSEGQEIDKAWERQINDQMASDMSEGVGASLVLGLILGKKAIQRRGFGGPGGMSLLRSTLYGAVFTYGLGLSRALGAEIGKKDFLPMWNKHCFQLFGPS